MPHDSQLIRAAYFSMEIALAADIPTYAGGLGVLAGDTLRSAADAAMPLAAVTLLYRKGYFDQHLDAQGNQTETPTTWNPEAVLEPKDARATIVIEGRKIVLRAWQYSVRGIGASTVPVFLLDSALPENTEFDQTLTDHLYAGDTHYRLCQEVVLGIGGMAMLNALGCKHLANYHMNEGHAALLTIALLESVMRRRPLKELTPDELDAVKRKCIFTTHTPVPAGHDKFPRELVHSVLGDARTELLDELGSFTDGILNMTYLGVRASNYINGVAMRHAEISRSMFPGYTIHAITNGVHAATWAAPAFQELFDKHMPEWRHDNNYLRYAIGIPLEEIQAAHESAKHTLLQEIHTATGVNFDASVMTIGFARRAATYKRADFLFSDPDRLKSIALRVGPIQVVYGGKAHPSDEPGKALIHRVFDNIVALKDYVRIVYIPNYDLRWGQLMTSGVDLWLNTPIKPYEASGTSGMKAALNGVPSFSVPDGWWPEGHVEGVTGWDIAKKENSETQTDEVTSMYEKLEFTILPMFYKRRNTWAGVMRHAIALNGSFFNTQRMLAEYVLNAYFQEDKHRAAKAPSKKLSVPQV
jgi:glycogen phosphorylase